MRTQERFMGFQYLKGQSWTQVTREERFFCQRLYEIVRQKPVEFVLYLSKQLALEIDTQGEWEIGYEVCFYRDLWNLWGRDGKPYSPKRTFDFCLFGENAILIIEAKATSGFDSDQNEVFKNDISEVRKLTGIQNVQLIGLCSSMHQLDKSSYATFGNRIVRWIDLATRYQNDQVLIRADSIYEKRVPYDQRGRNSNTKLLGSELLDVFKEGKEWWVGRGGGIEGARFQEDIRTGQWKTRKYEVNTKDNGPPSSNFFSLANFVEAVSVTASWSSA